jgi:acyl carrier protein
MVPSAFVFLKAFPLTPNGKIDRRQLPKPQASQADDYVAPHNALEEKLAAIWAEALGVERVGLNDNFEDLGGHSLTAIQITLAIRRDFSVDFPVQAFFDSPTISGLTAELEAIISRNSTAEGAVYRCKGTASATPAAPLSADAA